jgi:hypothetical protein
MKKENYQKALKLIVDCCGCPNEKFDWDFDCEKRCEVIKTSTSCWELYFDELGKEKGLSKVQLTLPNAKVPKGFPKEELIKKAKNFFR